MKVTSSDCLLRLRRNLSDVALGKYAAKDGTYYYVPDINQESYPGILSGYNVGEYIKNMTSRPHSEYGVLENYKVFDVDTYLVTILLCFTIFVAERLCHLNLSPRGKKVSPMITRRPRTCPSHRTLDTRTVALLKSVSFFFIYNIFINLYKTSQVVTEKPYVITDYKSLIKSNVSVFQLVTANWREYFVPSDVSRKKKDISYRIYKYLKRKQFSRKKYNQKYRTNRTLIDRILFEKRYEKSLVNKEFVTISHFGGIQMKKNQYCVWLMGDSANEHLRLFTSKDPDQRGILVGYAFRVGFNDPLVRKKLKRLKKFRTHASKALSLISSLKTRLNAKLRGKQMLSCLESKIEVYEKETTFASDIQSFKAFFSILAHLLVVAFYVLVSENFISYWR